MTRCAITRCNDYSPLSLDTALRTIIDNTDFPEVNGKVVFIKPNILSDSLPEKAITTDARAVEALINILKEKGAEKIILGDSPGTQTGKLSLRLSSFDKTAERTGAVIQDFRESNRIHEIDGLKIPMAAALDNSDVVISFAKFKTHQLMSATGAVKNMFGTIPGLNKSPMHFRYRTPESFARFIMQVFSECHVDYAFIDAVIGMEGPGPGNGDPRHVGLMMGSENAYSLDKAEAMIMGYESVSLIATAEKAEPGITDADYPLLKPEDIIIRDYKRIGEGKKNTLRSIVGATIINAFHRHGSDRPRPIFDADKCKVCSRCVEICPAKALSIKDGHVSFEKKKCITCYCCHEVCPFDAIKVL